MTACNAPSTAAAAPPATAATAQRLPTVPRAAAIVTATVGLTALLLTFTQDVVGFPYPAPLGVIQIDSGTAFMLLVSALALGLSESSKGARNSRLLAVPVMLFGLFQAIRYGLSLNALPDTDLILFIRSIASIAPGGAVDFAFLGLALLLRDGDTRFQRRISTALTLSALGLALFAGMGIVFHALLFREIATYEPMRPGTAVTMTALCLGLLFTRPEREPLATITSRTSSGVTARRLLLASLLTPLLGWLRVLGQQYGLFASNAGTTLFCAATLFGLSAFIWWNARCQRVRDAEKLGAERALRESEGRYRLLFENNPLPMWICDAPTQRLLSVNEAAVRHYGYTRDEFLARSLRDIVSERDMPVAVEGDVPLGRTALRRHRIKGGREIAVEVTTVDASFATAGRPSYLMLMTDVTERERIEAQARRYSRELEAQKRELQEANERLRDLATRDGLTGLFNHRVFYECLSDSWDNATRYQHPLSLLLIDVDRFKNFNDTFGHPRGDDVLQTVARLLEQESRSGDIVARYGGEEFAVLLPYADATAAVRMAERMRQVIEKFAWPTQAVTVSVGVATRSEFVSHARALVQAADGALYQSKRRGRNRVTSAEPVGEGAALPRH